MVERVRPSAPKVNGDGGVYFAPKAGLFLPSGCTLLDCALSDGRGWPLGKIVNIVGDKSTGKTLLAEEAMANFVGAYPLGNICYRESEAAFDVSYAQALGLDTRRVDFGPDGEDSSWATIEDVFEDLNAYLTKVESVTAERAKKLREKNKRLPPKEALMQARAAAPPCLYIIDSLDALSSASEIGRDIREGSYNLGKQKMLGELFRALVRRVRQARVCVMFISQTRARIGPMIRGKQYTRAGGKALDFYASIVLYLSEIGKLHKTVGGIKRVTGIRVKARVEKNKITFPFAECIFTIRFRYGIDDELSSFDYLTEVKKLRDAGFEKIPEDLAEVDGKKLRGDVTRIWREIEQRFTPPRGKYVT